ncbi:MAG: MATE family efflux transporter [Clostridiales bacterium]|nr:MATE family efflux transporter [Clostridiales bacterium]
MFISHDRDFYKSFIKLSLALMIEQAVILSVNLADNVMLGNYSESALSGVAAVNQIQFVLQQVVYGISNGMIVLGSQYWGQKRLGEIKKLSAIGAWFALAITVMLFIAVSLWPRGALALFTGDGPIIDQGVRYLDIMRFSYMFFGLTTVMLGTLRVIEIVRIALRVSLVSLVINVSINFLLIQGRFGFPEMGVRGAAIGTLTARVVEFIIVAHNLFVREDRLGLKPREWLHVDRVMLGDFVKVSTPIIVAAFLWGVNNAVQTVILGHMDKSAIAAQSISSTIYLLLKVTSVGAASAASILIGKTVGAGDMDKVREYTRTLQVIFVGIGLTLALLMTIIRFPLLAVYNITDETRRMANAFMTIQTITIFTMSYQMAVNTGIVRGGGDTRFILIVDLVSIFGIVLPLSLLGAFVWDLSPVAVTFILNSDQIFKCVPAFIRCNSYKWIKNLTRPERGG